MTREHYSGRCLCGAVTWAAAGPALWMGDCHCESCRRATSSGKASFIGVKSDGFAWTGAEPKFFASAPGVDRSFCGTCGSPMSYASTRFADEVHLYAATLDDPSVYRPEFAVHCAEAIGWSDAPEAMRHAGSYDPVKAERDGDG